MSRFPAYGTSWQASKTNESVFECSKTGLCVKVKVLRMFSRGKTWKQFKCDRGPLFQVTNFNRNFTQFRPSTMSDCTKWWSGHATARNFKGLSQVHLYVLIVSRLKFYHWNLHRKINVCCLLAWGHYLSRNDRNNVLIGLTDLSKESYRKSW